MQVIPGGSASANGADSFAERKTEWGLLSLAAKRTLTTIIFTQNIAGRGKRNPTQIGTHQSCSCERAVGESFNTSGLPFSRTANSSAISLLQRAELARATA
jgi:hypothetical protein